MELGRINATGQVPGNRQAYRLMPWAWLAAWTLTGTGALLSDIYSSPSKSPIAFFSLSAVGWALAGIVTARASRGKTRMAVQLVAWGVAYLVAIPLGLLWRLGRETASFLLFDPFLLAGAIGGFASSARQGAWRLISGSLVGLVFLLFSPIITFYSGMLLLSFYSSTINRYGAPLGSSYNLAWVLPNVIFGLVAGFAMRRILGFKAVASTSPSA
jgi:hypothetical protein